MGEAKFRARRSATPGTNAISSLLKHTSLHDHCSADPSSPDSSSASNTPGGSMVRHPRFIRGDAQTLTAIRSLPRSSNLVLFTPVVAPEPDGFPSAPAEGGAVQEPPGKGIGGRASADVPMDPFEPLGRALSRHHSRVRHVPYVPSVGMTTTHQTFLEHAAAIVLVVVCNNSIGRFNHEPGYGSPDPRHETSYRSSFPLPPRRRSPSTPTPASVKLEADFTRHQRVVLDLLPSDPAYRFAIQALIASWDLEQQRPARSPPVPTVLLLVDEHSDAELKVALIERLVGEMVTDVHAGKRPCYRTVLTSESYSARVLTAVAEMMFECEV